jgi:uncharacterized protein GlcG (DUF336 family)
MSERISLGQAQAAVAAAIEEAQKDGRSMAAVVVDARGDLICCARMDTTPERVLRFAIRKAYTAAVMGRDTLAFKRDMQQAERTLADYGDPNFTTLQGGLVVRSQGQVIGGIAVGGNTNLRDEEVARAALRALGVED